jgi:hypothetical protein
MNNTILNNPTLPQDLSTLSTQTDDHLIDLQKGNLDTLQDY